MGLFKKKVYLTQSQERRFLALSQYYHLPFDHFIERALEQFLEKELRAIRPEPPRAPNDVQRGHPRIPPMPPVPPATRVIIEGEK
ncbi:hypothetical protein beppo_85 [Salmonella phage beppo]|uniref:Uncharacterized protein n=1 Tax=Salmonella phage beppo TaxID=2713280 RepID=A0A6G8RFQ4_9CAUD|nr:hypothetical protein beppo_85 [Salmonella phage beppo]